MDELLALKEITWFEAAGAVIAVFIFFRFLVSSWEWFATKFGWETKKMRQRREDHELLIKTSQNLAALQEKHEEVDKKHEKDENDIKACLASFIAETKKEDDKRHDKDESDIKACLASFIAETKKENDSLRAEMKRFAENRINDRQISIEREGRLNVRIDTMAEADKYRDEHIDSINSNLDKLTTMLVDKEISDIRWTILDFTSSLSNGREYNNEAFNQIFAIYDRYERILEEHNMENGLVTESMEYIREKYKGKLRGEL